MFISLGCLFKDAFATVPPTSNFREKQRILNFMCFFFNSPRISLTLRLVCDATRISDFDHVTIVILMSLSLPFSGALTFVAIISNLMVH